MRSKSWMKYPATVLQQLSNTSITITSHTAPSYLTGAKHKQEKKDLDRGYQDRIRALEESLEQEKQMLEIERDRFKAKFKRDKDKYDRELRDMRANVEEQISLDMQGKMEVCYTILFF